MGKPCGNPGKLVITRKRWSWGETKARDALIQSIAGLEWVMAYYYEGVASWSWFFNLSLRSIFVWHYRIPQCRTLVKWSWEVVKGQIWTWKTFRPVLNSSWEFCPVQVPFSSRSTCCFDDFCLNPRFFTFPNWIRKRFEWKKHSGNRRENSFYWWRFVG